MFEVANRELNLGCIAIRNYHKYLGNLRHILSDDMSLYYLVTFCCLEFDKEFHHLSADPPFLCEDLPSCVSGGVTATFLAFYQSVGDGLNPVKNGLQKANKK